MKKILAIVRKSPTNTPEVSIKAQKQKIQERILIDLQSKQITATEIIWAIDICKGDDAEGRVQLNQALKEGASQYQRAYCLNADRFSRSWLGIKWFHEHFLDTQLHFVEGLPNLYDKDGNVNHESYLFFFIQCGYAQYELLKIRKRTAAGIERIKSDPKLRKKKYKGRKKGAKDRRKRKKEGYKARWKKNMKEE